MSLYGERGKNGMIAITLNSESNIGDPEKEISERISALFKLNGSEFLKQHETLLDDLKQEYPEHKEFINKEYWQQVLNHKEHQALIESKNVKVKVEEKKFNLQEVTVIDPATKEETKRSIWTEGTTKTEANNDDKTYCLKEVTVIDPVTKKETMRTYWEEVNPETVSPETETFQVDTIYPLNAETMEEEVKIVKMLRTETAAKEEILELPPSAPPFPPEAPTEISKTVLREYSKIYTAVDEWPRFPGCEDMNATVKEKDECAKQKMLEFIYSNLKYPEEARKNKVEGVTVVQFVVNKDGSLTDIEIAREIGGGCGDASKSVVEKMNTMAESWIPGKQNNEAVNTKYIIPIKYKLADEPKTEIEEKMAYPLIVLDGEIVDAKAIEDLNVESVTVYKGAEAIQKFGSQGADGVVEMFSGKSDKDAPELKDFSIDKIEFENFKVFPNPIKNTLNLSFTSKEEGQVDIHLFDGTGKQIAVRKNQSKEFNEIIDLSHIPTGNVLFLTISQNNKVHTQKIIRTE